MKRLGGAAQKSDVTERGTIVTKRVIRLLQRKELIHFASLSPRAPESGLDEPMQIKAQVREVGRTDEAHRDRRDR